MFAIIAKNDNSILRQYASTLEETDDYICIEIPEGITHPKAVLTEGVYSIIEDTQAAKQTQISAINAAMNADINTQMFATYETTDRVTANAIQQSWADIALAPEVYVPAVFPSVEVAVAYVTPKIAAARAFNIWRIGRVAQRDADIAALGV